MPLPNFDPPLINSANPWATTQKDIQALFNCPNAGGITTRTTLLNGFAHDPATHQYTFFRVEDHGLLGAGDSANDFSTASIASLNTLGYSPIPLDTYLAMLGAISVESRLTSARSKPIIISVTGTPEEVAECLTRIEQRQRILPNPLCMEVNLSCPNIPGKPPPAYSSSALSEYLQAIGHARTSVGEQRVYIGIKTPPYTYDGQYRVLIDALLAVSTQGFRMDFITATNTLGSSLVMNETNSGPALTSSSGFGIGGIAGPPLHPLALGNVKTLRSMLDQHETLRSMSIIGIGGVSDRGGFDRMRAVGAEVVGVGTALGRKGVGIFDEILNGS